MRLPSRLATIGPNRVDPQRRMSELRWLNRNDPDLNWLFEKFKDLFNDTNKKIANFELNDFREIQFTTYKAEDQAHYDWHVDTFWKSANLIQRKLSLVLQLSDATDYEGGRLDFEHDKLDSTQFTEMGDIVVFASVLRHRATRVTRGVRHSLVTWCYGPNFR